MKNLYLLIPLIAAMAGLSSAQTPAPATSPASLVTLRVKVENDHDDPKNSTKEVVSKNLSIQISGAKSVTGNLQVITKFYARDLDRNTTVEEKQLEDSATLDANHSASLITSPVRFTFTPSYTKKSGSGNRAKYTKIEATGKKYYGWSVQVFQEGKLLGEAASASFFKESSKRDK